MFRNYFLTAWRNLARNKAFSVLNILGLSIGMAVALLIGLWVHYQYSFDRFFPEYQRVYQAHIRYTINGERAQMSATPMPLSAALRNDIPGIQYAVHTDWINSHGLVAGKNKVFLPGVIAEGDFFRIFRCEALKGNLNNALKGTYSIVLTESTAKALFGDEDALNKTVRIDNTHDLVVAAVIRDLPGNATLSFDYVVPFDYWVQTDSWVKGLTTNWNNNTFQTFVALQPGVSYAKVEPGLQAILDKYTPRSSKQVIFLQAMKDWHLYSDFKDGYVSGGFIEYVKLFGLIGLLVLLIACVNFMNLSTARSEKRAREVGVRKAMGSRRQHLILQFLVESIVLTSAAAATALALTALVLPSFNLLTGNPVVIPWGNVYFWIIMGVYVLLTGVLAGSRPAFYLSSFEPVKVLKGVITAGPAAAWPRKILVVLQFTCSIALIISTFLIYQQVQYARNRPTGYDASRLVMTGGSADLSRQYPALRDELMGSGLVGSITTSNSFVTGLWNWSNIQNWSGRMPDESLSMATVYIGDDYFKTMGMQLLAGRGYTGHYIGDSSDIILNEAAVKRMRLKDPVGQLITWHMTPHRVIGVVKDALMLSPYDPATPTLFNYRPDEAGNITFRLSKRVNVSTAIARLNGLFSKYNPAFPFLYTFADDTYAQKFGMEVLIGKLAALFAGLAIFISCLGLFGLAAYMAEQRTREIGIRKVLGASVAQLWLLLSKDFLALVLVSCIVASPLAYYFLHGWLQKYDYRITIGPWVFVVAAGMALLITLATVSFQAIRGALVNPTRSLRSE
jgi:putative ABC transport system permease protein